MKARESREDGLAGGGVEEGEGWPPLHPRGQCPLLSSDEITIMD